MSKGNEAIISIKPQFAEAILDGSKTVELRRRIPRLKVGTRLWIYATMPTGAVIGCATVEGIAKGTPEDLWAAFSDRSGVSREIFDQYFSGTEQAIALQLTDIIRARPIQISQLKSIRAGFHPPQVISLLTDAEANSLGMLAAA